MTEAISKIRFKEIYELSTDDKLDLIDFLVKSVRSAVDTSRKTMVTPSWVDQFEGQWIDSKSADEMVADIRNSRTQNSSVTL